MGPIIISKFSLQREKQIWNPKSNESEISKAIQRNEHVQKSLIPPFTYVILELSFLPSFFSHPGQGQAEHMKDYDSPRWHQIHESLIPAECRILKFKAKLLLRPQRGLENKTKRLLEDICVSVSLNHMKKKMSAYWPFQMIEPNTGSF